MKKSLVCILHLLCIFSVYVFAGTQSHLDDGPYIFRRGDNLRVITVSSQDKITDTIVPKAAMDSFTVNNSSGNYCFSVALMGSPVREELRQQSPRRTFVISDPHSNFEDFADILRRGKVVDSTLTWEYGHNHLVIAGDVFDRGNDATAIFWLIYKLEHEAEKSGGRVHYLIGNHDNMVLQNNTKYSNKKYLNLADSLGVEYADLWSGKSILGEWLRTKNAILILGNTLFVHGGISMEMVNRKIDLAEANRIISKYIDLDREARKSLPEDDAFLFGNDGPIWYRGLVEKEEKYHPISESELNTVLKYCSVDRIVIGHTTFSYMTFFFNGKVIAIDSKNKRLHKAHLGHALELIGSDKWRVVD